MIGELRQILVFHEIPIGRSLAMPSLTQPAYPPDVDVRMSETARSSEPFEIEDLDSWLEREQQQATKEQAIEITPEFEAIWEVFRSLPKI